MITEILTYIRKRREERLAIQQLARLSDYQLNDIGVNRATLEQAIRFGGRV